MLELKLLNSLNKIWINFNYHILCHDFLDVTPVKKKKKVKLKFIRIKKNNTKKVKRQIMQCKYLAWGMNRHFSKEINKWSVNKWCPMMSLRKCKSKLHWDIGWHPLGCLKSKIIPSISEDVQNSYSSYIAGGNVKWCSHFVKYFDNSSKC